MYALHFTDPAGDSPMQSVSFNLPAGYGGRLWGRAFIYTTPKAPSGHGGIFKGRYSPNLNWYEVGYEMANYMAFWHPPQPPGTPEWVMRTNTPVVIDDWACVEWDFNGTAAAEPRVFVNGPELVFTEKFVSPTGDGGMPQIVTATDFVVVELGLVMYHLLADRTELWFDDVALGKARIGCQ
jgi:hypothetical protein